MATIAIDDAAWGSPWRHHRVGEKMLWSLGLIITALVAPVWPGTILVGVVSIVLILGFARIRVSMLVGAMAAPVVFIIVGALSVLLSVGRNPVNPYWQWGFLSITPESRQMAINLIFHALCGTLAVMVLALTTPMADILNWMLDHKVPHQLVEVASLTYRMLFILWGSALAVFDAQRRRGGVHTVRSWKEVKLRLNAAGQATGTLMIRAWSRAQKLEAGLRARGAEESLATTTLERERSWAMVLGCLLTLAAIWLISAGWMWIWRS